MNTNPAPEAPIDDDTPPRRTDRPKGITTAADLAKLDPVQIVRGYRAARATSPTSPSGIAATGTATATAWWTADTASRQRSSKCWCGPSRQVAS